MFLEEGKMRFVVLIIGALWLAIGITVAYVPASVPDWLALETVGPYIRYVALFPLIMGLLLLIAAGRLRLALYLRIIGTLAVLKGLFFLFSPLEYINWMMGWYLGLPVWFMRISGFVSIVLSLIVLVVAIISLFEEDVI